VLGARHFVLPEMKFSAELLSSRHHDWSDARMLVIYKRLIEAHM
jgi:hypothetical protein